MRSPHALLFVCLLSAAMTSQAGEPVRIAEVVPYREGVGTDAMRAECTWNRRLAARIVKGSKGAVVATAEPLENLEGPVLRIEVVGARSAGGAMHTGPKWATIRGELSGRGAEPLTFEIRRSTIKGWKACTALDRVADTLAQDVLAWLDNPAVFPPAAAAPPEG